MAENIMQTFDISKKKYYMLDVICLNDRWVDLGDGRYRICAMNINQRVGWLIVNSQQYNAIRRKGNCDRKWLMKFIHIQHIFWGNYMNLVVDDLSHIVKNPKVLDNSEDLGNMIQYANDVLNQRKAISEITS